MDLSSEQRRRYNRHLILEGFGHEAQEKLLQAKVLLVGAGGLGSPVALYLAAAGVGTIGVVDGDTVSITNLQRQVLHSTKDINRPKVEVARERIEAMNPDVNVRTYELYLNEANAMKLIESYDFVIDGTDNFATKYLVNDACVMLDKAFTMGGISKYSGQVMTHLPGTACYRCLFPEPPAKEDVETCATVGVLGSIAGMLGTVQATECIKYLAGVGQPLTNTLLTFDALSMQWQRFDFGQRSDCALCGEHPSIHELKEYAFKPCAKRI
ncbi:HesA/MoeB/ThiF family protein [Prevotella sp. MA2016]|uniref:HesA/MoeB/ThiF family protein n=1 Tax=Prevotella sp. MA2016 TaxID=1408310 RepID=UPI00048C8FAB|nr:HesA/MoeB/ThiF family protein [Prevotella sp. MA2016]